MTRVSIIHDRSNDVAEADNYRVTNDDEVYVYFNDDPDCHIQIGDWYHVIIGDEGNLYSLDDAKDLARKKLVFTR